MKKGAITIEKEEIIIKRDGKEIKVYQVPEFGECKFIIQNGKTYRVETTDSTIIKDK